MIYKRGRIYWYKFVWSIRHRYDTSKSFLVRRSARTKIESEAVEVEHRRRSAWAKFTRSIPGASRRRPKHQC